MPKITVGSKVRISAKHLRSTGRFTGPDCFMRGTVTDIEPGFGPPPGLATVKWDDTEYPPRILAVNLSLVGVPEVD